MGKPLDQVPAIIPPGADELGRGLYTWDVPGATVILPFLSADPIKDDSDWLDDALAAMPRLEGQREYLVDFSVYTGKPVYSEYRDHLHAAAEPLPYYPGRVIVRGHDIPGPLACVWMQLVPMERSHQSDVGATPMRLHVLSELYSALGVTDYFEQVKQQSTQFFPKAQHFVDWCDPAAWARDQEKQTAVQKGKAAGISLSPGPVAWLARSEPVRSWLTRVAPTRSARERAGAMLIDPSCVMIKDGFKGGYHYAEIEKSGRYKESPEKNEFSHVMNAMEYGVAMLASSGTPGKTAKPLDFTRTHQLGTI